MNPRLYDRLAATVSVILLTMLALFTIYLARAAERDRARAAPASVAPGQPDYFVDRLALLTMTSTGAPGYRIEAHRLVHFPDDDTARFESPTLISLTPDRPRLTVTADTGLLFNPTPQRATVPTVRGVVVKRAINSRAVELRPLQETRREIQEGAKAAVAAARRRADCERARDFMESGSCFSTTVFELRIKIVALGMRCRERDCYSMPA
jgi:lipopolysaccharide export system protein LptC